jgi:hypothetical protein
MKSSRVASSPIECDTFLLEKTTPLDSLVSVEFLLSSTFVPTLVSDSLQRILTDRCSISDGRERWRQWSSATCTTVRHSLETFHFQSMPFQLRHRWLCSVLEELLASVFHRYSSSSLPVRVARLLQSSALHLVSSTSISTRARWTNAAFSQHQHQIATRIEQYLSKKSRPEKEQQSQSHPIDLLHRCHSD